MMKAPHPAVAPLPDCVATPVIGRLHGWRTRVASLLAGLALLALAGRATAADLVLDKSVYLPGESIAATFGGGPGNASDWVGIYASGVTPSGNPPSQLWKYTNGTQTKGGSLQNGAITFAQPTLGEGNYAAWFLANDGYQVLKGPVAFAISSGAVPAWRVNAIYLPHGVAGNSYAAKIAAYASAPLARGFSKVSGPAWLQVSAQGVLSGTPTSNDTGLNTFMVRLSGASQTVVGDVPLTIEVAAVGQENVSRFSILSHNTWYNWTKVNDGLQKAAAAIVQSGADLVGLQESTNASAQQMADELGWYRASTGVGSAQILSRYPIVQTYAVNGFDQARLVGARIRLAQNPVRDVVFFDCHTDYTHYGPYAAQTSGATASSVLAEENLSTRASQVAAILNVMSGQLAQADAAPVFLTGDFNAPSHLDWTAATAAAHGGVGAVAWPTSSQVVNAGMLDSLRTLHPDPAKDPNNSWSTIHKGTEAQDRIDFVYHKGKPVRVLAAGEYHTAVEVTLGAWDINADTTPVRNNTWPSDHAAILATFAVDPVDADGNGLSDAWEQRWFQGVGQAPNADLDGDGLDNRSAAMFGVAPVSPGKPPLLPVRSGQSPPRLSLSLSDLALGSGVVVERSGDLTTWDALWSFDSDPGFNDAVVAGVTPRANGEWTLSLTDLAARPGDASGFYRLSWHLPGVAQK